MIYKIWNLIPNFIQNLLKWLVVIFKDNIKTKKYSVVKHFVLMGLLNEQIILGKRIRIKMKNWFYGKIKIGDYSYIAGSCLILGNEKFGVEIGKFCSIASDVSFLAFNDHNQEKLTTYPPSSGTVMLSKNLDIGKPIVVGNDVWIGKNSIILKGVTVGTGAIIGAGAVVTKDVPPYAVVGGNPAKVIKYRFNDKTIKMLLESERWNRDIEKIRQNYNLEFLNKYNEY